MCRYSAHMSSPDQSTILWIADGLATSSDGTLTSSVASSRLRSILPAQAVNDSGLPCELTSFEQWLDHETTAQLLVVGKLIPSTDPKRFHRLAAPTLERLRRARAEGRKVVADFSDDHFLHPDLGYYWRELACLIDVGVAASDRMADVLRTRCNAQVHVVPDPLSSPMGEARSYGHRSWMSRMLNRGATGANRAMLKLVWYGHPNNLRHLWTWLDALCTLGPSTPWLLWILTEPRPDVVGALQRRQQRVPAHGLVDLIEWSEQAQWSTVASADVVLLPSDAADTRSSVKSANRLTDALHAGRPVIASPLHSYLAYAEFVDLSGNVLKALEDFQAFPELWRDRTRAGQAHVAATLGLPAIGKAWGDLLRACMLVPTTGALNSNIAAIEYRNVPQDVSSTASNQVSVAVDSPEVVVRLNLGCGDKILPGYVNVDVVASRAGAVPDVICDLRDLQPFNDATVDEVMAIHVVEHFWRWEVEAILREWIRVLKPGGRMVLECPNLVSACQEILDHPESANGVDKSAQRTLWVLYGDPAWRDPLMTHRWAYTPQSLCELMTAVGLTGVRQEKAQFKLREPRDMRLVGIKR